MNLPDLLNSIGEPQSAETLAPHWDESVASLGTACPAFLTPDEIRLNREWSGIEEGTEALLLETARRIREQPALLRLAWHCYQLLYRHPDYESMAQWPSLEQALGELSGAFYLLIALAMVPQTRAVHCSLGVPESVSRATCGQLAGSVALHRRITGGRLGVPVRTIFWLRNYTSGRLFRVGRMEYMIAPFRRGLSAYRNRETGEIIAIARDGIRYDGDGYLARRDLGPGYDANCWTAEVTTEGGTVSGYPISPHGMALRQKVELPPSLWDCVLQDGDLTLDMHIPGGGGMTLDRCRDSMRDAVAFFRRTFPDRPFSSISSSSWIFNTQLEMLRLSSENLVRFQRELYLFPTPSSGRDGIWFIFLQPEEDLDVANLPRDTSLRRAVADLLAAGNRWRGGGMCIMVDDLDRFGTQWYRSASSAVIEAAVQG